MWNRQVYWQLTTLGAKCEVVAPTLVPVKSGDRVKTDRCDALKLARNYRAGEFCWSRMGPMRPCAIWYAHGRLQRKTSYGRDIG